MRLKKPLLLAATALLTTTAARAGGDGWMTDFEAAKKKAAAEGKDLFVDFTGSDWCGWCKRLNQEVFQHEPFQKGVADKYILVELDYPRKPETLAKQSDEIKAQNAKLQQTYQIQGFPTILITDAEGRPYAKTGYREGGPEAYLTHLAELQENKKNRDAAFAKAESQKGLEKATALFEGLQAVPEDYRGLYRSVIETIKANDPDDTTGLIAATEQQEAMIELERQLQNAMRGGDSDQAVKLVDDFVKKYEPAGEEKQKLLAIKLNIHYSNNDFDAMEKVIDEIIAIDPNSRYGQQLTGFKEGQLQELKKKKAAQEKE
jgi:thioredoxin-related protein